MTSPLWPRAVLHLDMDAFYVNVHLLDHPEHQGKPLVVGGKPTERGVVASASYEARQLGIRSAMPTSQAMRLCRDLLIVPANWPRIRECSQAVMEILHGYGPVEQMSVDEAYIELSHYEQPEQLAAAVQTHVFSQTHLPASVGLATNKLVAKVASDFHKPQGCTIVPPGQEATFLAPQPVRVIWGIGPRAAERLQQVGIERCGELAAASLTRLKPIFKNQAEQVRQRANGQDDRPVVAERGQNKSISQEWTFTQDVADAERLRQKLHQMGEQVVQSLQAENLIAHTVTVKFRRADFTTFTRQKTVAIGTDEAGTILALAEAIWQEHWTPGQPLRLLGVGVSNLAQVEGRQLRFRF
ncbi:MAG: DNA polymerase IV [Anaerolineae bacterium]|nr:DNA polymerase IV [Anaerolineae bacterium]